MQDTYMLNTAINTEDSEMAKQPTIIEQLRALDEQRAVLVESAYGSAMEQAEEAVSQLNMLGRGKYRLIDESQVQTTRPMKAKKEGTVREKRAVECPVCEYMTDPPHDKRAHRNGKPAFTDEDLAERGWSKVEV